MTVWQQVGNIVAVALESSNGQHPEEERQLPDHLPIPRQAAFRALGKVSEQEAEAKSAQVEYLLMRIKQGLIELPAGVNIADFVQHDGKLPVPKNGDLVRSVAKGTTLATLRDGFIEARRSGREKSTQHTTGIHFKHLAATLGERFPLPELGQADLQRHIERNPTLPACPYRPRRVASPAAEPPVDCLMPGIGFSLRHPTGRISFIPLCARSACRDA
jgi:hypothetical protein